MPTTGDNFGITTIETEGADNWNVWFLVDNLKLDACLYLDVINRTTATPPGSPAAGDRYLVASSPTGAWIGRTGQIAVFRSGSWNFYTPKEGWLMTSQADAGKLYKYQGGSFTEITGSGGSPGGSDTQLQRNNSGAFGGISGATSDGTNVTFGSGNLRTTAPRVTTSINDANGNELIIATATSSAVNEITIANAATGGAPEISATGSDTNVALRLSTKGTGIVNIPGGLVINAAGTTSNYPLQISGSSKGGAFFGINTSSAANGDIINYAALSNAVTGSIIGFSYSAQASTGFGNTLANNDSTNSTANASFKIQTNGASSGDPFFQMTVSGATDWSIGVDNSASDALIIGPNSTPSTGTPALSIATTGKTTFPATTTTRASLTVPHGTAPTSPADGDLWTTTAGIYVRINGATVGPLGTGGGGSVAGSNTQVQYNASGAFGASADFAWDNTNKILTVAGSAAQIRNQGGQHPGTGSGFIMPFVGGSQSSGPGIWWSSNNYAGTSGLWLSNGLNFQGASSTHSPLKIRKSTGTSSDGAVVFTFTPDSDLLILADAVSIEGGTTTGTKILTGTTQKLGFHGATPVAKQTVTGSRGSNAALADLLTKLANLGLIVDSTT